MAKIQGIANLPPHSPPPPQRGLSLQCLQASLWKEKDSADASGGDALGGQFWRHWRWKPFADTVVEGARHEYQYIAG
jgi:hypothetical protein